MSARTKLAVVLGSLTLLAGCGGTKTVVTTVTTPASAATTTTPRVSARASFIAAGDASCAAFNRKLDPVNARIADSGYDTAPDEAARQRILQTRVLPAWRAIARLNVRFQQEWDGFRRPHRPADDEIVSLVRRGVASQLDAADALARRDMDAHQAALATSERLTVAWSAAARVYGFKVCGRG